MAARSTIKYDYCVKESNRDTGATFNVNQISTISISMVLKCFLGSW